jgi:hypothetical protein
MQDIRSLHLLVVEGVYIQQGRKRTPEHHPRGKGGGLITEAIGIAVEAAGADHGILVVQRTGLRGRVAQEDAVW